MEREELIERIKENGLTTEQYEECLEILSNNVHYADLILQKVPNIPVDTLRRSQVSIFGGKFIYDYMKNKDKPQDTFINNTINKDGTQSSNKLIEMSEEQSKDASYLLKIHGFDENFWQIASAKNSQWHQNSNKNGLTTLYSSNIVVKPKTDNNLTINQLETLFNKLKTTCKPINIKTNNNYLKGDKLLLIDIADLHYNLQASLFTTNNDYDVDIAEHNFMKVLTDIINRTNMYKFEKILFVIGGDMMNSDNLKNATTKGTPQDNQLHYYDACEKLYELTIKAINTLSQIAPVNVLHVPGNHDEVTGYTLAKFVDAWYNNINTINVDYKPLPRKYVKYGNTLLCFMHDGKVKDIPALISNEAREYWSQVNTVEVFLQHLHTEQILLENHNIRIQRLPTISGNSKWTNDSGYNSKKQCKSFIFDKEDGLTDVLYTNIN